MLRIASRVVIGPLSPLLRLMDPTMRSATAAGKDVIELAVGDRFKGTTGYFTLLQEGEGPADSLDEVKQTAVWNATDSWCRM